MRDRMRELALFAGAGGGILGGLLLGWRTVCAVELDPYCRSVLLARQRDGLLPRFPIWDDVRTFDGNPWNGGIEVISGGFPCQDISSVGPRTGLDGERSGLWREFARIIEEVEPAHVFIENSQHLRTRGLVVVLQDLARMGFHAKWGVFGAENVRAPHPRKRMWIIADANRGRQRVVAEHEQMAGASAPDGALLAATLAEEEEAITRIADWWPVDLIQGVDDGVANRMDRVAATGNGQVPRVARLAWETLR